MATEAASPQQPSLTELRISRAATITRAQAAAVLGVDPRTITTAVQNGTIPSLHLGRRVLIPREKFLALFDTEAA